MSSAPEPTPEATFSTREKIFAYAVHWYTASGAVFAVLTLIAIVEKRYHMAYLWNSIAVIIDSSDGWFARKFRVKEVVPTINGRTLDDLIDFTNYTFLPLFLVWHKGLLPQPAWLWICVPIIASLFAFADEGVKDDEAGFFVGFPSYWNFFALYADLGFSKVGPWFTLGIMLLFSAMNVSNLRFVYPTKAKRWQGFFVWGAILWTAAFLYMLTFYTSGTPDYLIWGSFSYPALYVILSMYLDFEARRAKAKAAREGTSG